MKIIKKKIKLNKNKIMKLYKNCKKNRIRNKIMKIIKNKKKIKIIKNNNIINEIKNY